MIPRGKAVSLPFKSIDRVRQQLCLRNEEPKVPFLEYDTACRRSAEKIYRGPVTLREGVPSPPERLKPRRGPKAAPRESSTISRSGWGRDMSGNVLCLGNELHLSAYL